MLRRALSLEDIEIDNLVETNEFHEDGNIEHDISLVDAELSDSFDDSQTVSAVMESLSMYASEIESLIKTNSCTKTTAHLIHTGVQQQLNRLDVKLINVSLESYSDDVVAQHQLVLEGIRDIWNEYLQERVLVFKHIVNATSDFFKGTREKITKYKNKINESEAEFNSVKSNWKDNIHVGDLNNLWYHFSTDAGQAKNVIQEINKDLALSKYILTEYSATTIDMLGKLTSAISSGNLSSVANIIKVVKSIEALSNPADKFKTNLIGGKPFLSMTGLEVKTGDTRNTIDINGQSFRKLAELATPKIIIESGSWKHTAKKLHPIATGNIGQLADFILSKRLELSTNDIGTIFSSAKEYIEHVEKYLSMESSFSNVSNKFITAFQKLANTATDIPETKKVLNQIDQYSKNIMVAFQKPAVSEVARSIKGGKYCMYLGLRMVFNAK